MKKFVCPVCGYVYEGEFIPEGFKCPVCGVDGSKFKVMEEGKLAAEHEYGIYAKTVKNNPDISEEDKKYIFEQLMANFQGECSEVGMYLCMARIAHREGYPEIGLYWEKAAHEEAEHAAKFAEMLGEDLEPHMKATTKDNLAWRVDCEFGATQGKFDLAACAKKNGLVILYDKATNPIHKNVKISVENVNRFPIKHMIVFDKYITPLLKCNEIQYVHCAYYDSVDAKKWPKQMAVLTDEYERNDQGVPTWFNVNYEDVDGNEMFQRFELKDFDGKLYYALNSINDA